MLCFSFRKSTCRSCKEVASSIEIPVIGIGAGGGVDGQVLVLHDMLGITQQFSPRFLRRYHNLHQEILKACTSLHKGCKVI